MNLSRITLLIAALVAASSAQAAVNVLYNTDGTAYTDVFVNGTPALKYDIVFIGDGFTAAEQTKFNQRVDLAVWALWNLEPYASHMCAFNVYRVNVVSNESGVDHPLEGIYKDTELDCRYGNDVSEPERCISSDSPSKCWEAAGHAPDFDAVFVLVNDEQWGGCVIGGGLVYASIHPDFNQLITHELGHKIGDLADEYPYFYSQDDPPSTYTGPEPGRANVTKDPTGSKWADLISPGTQLPTTVDIPVGVVGAWEGAMYHSNGIYRPAFTCQMRDSSEDFCAVCKRHMAQTLENYEVEPPNLLCSGMLWELLAFARQPWLEHGWQIEIPWCLTCPPRDFGFDEVMFTMSGLPEGFNLLIVDEFGKVVGEGTWDDGELLAGFQAEHSTQYYAQVYSDAAPTGELLDVASQLEINGEQMVLP